ncbi:MAG: fluoride efflux transporter CrcB [Actinomycetota bacterium]|nr:MAG: fluoride efflux transporter CrcB [Actinomycetota bacterium]
MSELLLVVLGAAVGAPLRYLVEHAAARRGGAFPAGTLLVNVAGSFVLGLVLAASPSVRLLVGTGFCGALTTYSGFALATERLLSLRATALAVANVVANVVVCVLAVWAAVAIAN